MTSAFPTGLTARAIETGDVLAPQFDRNGLIPAVATDAATGEVLMLAWMNAEALARTIETREAHYFSRSRNSLWRKGETSGHTQRVEEIRVDCDQDAVWLKVTPQGGGCVCHTGARSCFYRRVDDRGALIPASQH
jgi:phosphoribosyl-AMP cyclohydrolase